VDEVRSDKLREEGWEDICQEHDAFGYGGADQVQGSREDDNVGDIVDQACRL
jgi:hypothetical protein